MAKEILYKTSDGKEFSENDVKKQTKDIKLDLMKTWFLNHYEDPADSCPHESKEGGYQWINGGPCDSKEELNAEFSHVVEDDIIATLADELDSLSPEWSPILNR